MSREYTTHGTVSHASEEAHSRIMFRPWSQVLAELGQGNDGDHDYTGTDHPYYELASLQQVQQLVKIVCWLSNGPEYSDQHSANAYKDSSPERPACEGLSKDE